MPSTTNATLIETVRETAHRLTGATGQYDPLMDLIGDACFVLLGEASHGTHEFYHERALITQRLIAEKGFTAVAVEADWPDAYRVNRYVRGASDDVYGIEALADFRRFPAWMWRNTDAVATDHGTVTAASDWGGPAERKRCGRLFPTATRRRSTRRGSPASSSPAVMSNACREPCAISGWSGQSA
jgi:hypothetical protein